MDNKCLRYVAIIIYMLCSSLVIDALGTSGLPPSPMTAASPSTPLAPIPSSSTPLPTIPVIHKSNATPAVCDYQAPGEPGLSYFLPRFSQSDAVAQSPRIVDSWFVRAVRGTSGGFAGENVTDFCGGPGGCERQCCCESGAGLPRRSKQSSSGAFVRGRDRLSCQEFSFLVLAYSCPRLQPEPTVSHGASTLRGPFRSGAAKRYAITVQGARKRLNPHRRVS